MSKLFVKESWDGETKDLTNAINKNTTINSDINSKQNTLYIINCSQKVNDNIDLNKKEDKSNELENNERIKAEKEKLNKISDNNTEIIAEENFKENVSRKSSETKKQNIIKIKFITTKDPKIDSNNSICSETEVKEKLNKPCPNLNNINLNQGQTEYCREIKETRTNIIAKEEPKEGNGIIYGQDFLKIQKKIREDNNIVKIKKKVLDNYLKNINSEIKEENLKLEKFNPEYIGNINSKENMDLYNSKMKDVIIAISEKTKKENEETDEKNQFVLEEKIPENKNKQIIAELELKYNEETEVRKLLEMKFSDYLKSFIENEKDWNEFVEESREDQKKFYIQKKYKKVIDDMRKRQCNKDLEEIKKYICFREPNSKGKKLIEEYKKENGNEKKIELDKFEYYYYKIINEEGFKSYIKSKPEYKNLKFDYDDEKKNIDAYIDNLKYLAENYYEFFIKRAPSEDKEKNEK